MTFFFFGSPCRIFVSAEYSADNTEYSAENVFGRSLIAWQLARHQIQTDFAKSTEQNKRNVVG
jgi:hypothetical protein